ncbi:MAG: glutamate formimidoyltransferase [Phycisphaerae bacterium]|nr:glutamate formimidoyltransferase [Phycisphaerae bacterium]MCZ2398286.1 glutamate formimidoyltransferase [Phycisphaerae bacterium]NUQ49842.1 glutamate formimidoyltransferase [Phycisphaerae bacterium]
MTTPLIECVPNFSEGRDPAVIGQITAAIESVEGVTLLDVDPGRATNRTVVTFVGPPQPVIEAAVRAGRKAKELVDMRRHKGEHPRFGAMDVCPLVPVANITMDEVVSLAHQLGQRLGDEVGISGYFYEYAARRPERRNLAACRAGEYEGLPAKLKDPDWKTDFGPGTFDPACGVTAVGARDFLVAYNVNLNTTSTRRANAVAFDIREKGRIRTVDGTPGGKPVLDDHGQPVWEPGSLKAVKAIGWYIAEYGIAQISINLTNLGVTPVHVAFDECCRRAEARGLRVTGSELVGLMPLNALLDAGRYFLRKQRRSLGVSDKELIKIAVKSLGLGDLYPFRPEEKIIEYAIAAKAAGRRGPQPARSEVASGAEAPPASLTRTPLDDFVWETASESPAPGGGSVSAAIGAMGAALATMVANLSAHKQGWDDRWEEFSRWAEEGKRCHDALLRLVDEDTAAFNALMASFGLPKGTDAEKAARSTAIQAATKGAIEAPLRVMQVALESMQVARQMAETGLPASVSDAGVAALAARSAVMGAHLNVKINARSVKDKAWIDDVLRRSAEMERRAQELEREILALVEPRLGT